MYRRKKLYDKLLAEARKRTVIATLNSMKKAKSSRKTKQKFDE